VGAACEATVATIMNPDPADIIQSKAWDKLTHQLSIGELKNSFEWLIESVFLAKSAY
jgi:hypothetical protein